MGLIIPAALWAVGNPVVMGYLAVGGSMAVKVVAGTSFGLIIAHSVFGE